MLISKLRYLRHYNKTFPININNIHSNAREFGKDFYKLFPDKESPGYLLLACTPFEMGLIKLSDGMFFNSSLPRRRQQFFTDTHRLRYHKKYYVADFNILDGAKWKGGCNVVQD
jgi:hypothetical protein